MTGSDYVIALKDAAFYAFLLGCAIGSIFRIFRIFR